MAQKPYGIMQIYLLTKVIQVHILHVGGLRRGLLHTAYVQTAAEPRFSIRVQDVATWEFLNQFRFILCINRDAPDHTFDFL